MTFSSDLTEQKLSNYTEFNQGIAKWAVKMDVIMAFWRQTKKTQPTNQNPPKCNS